MTTACGGWDRAELHPTPFCGRGQRTGRAAPLEGVPDELLVGSERPRRAGSPTARDERAELHLRVGRKHSAARPRHPRDRPGGRHQRSHRRRRARGAGRGGETGVDTLRHRPPAAAPPHSRLVAGEREGWRLGLATRARRTLLPGGEGGCRRGGGLERDRDRRQHLPLLPRRTNASLTCYVISQRKKERKQTTQGRDGRTVHRHHTGILRRGECYLTTHLRSVQDLVFF